MPVQPGANDVHVDRLLTQMSIGYQNAIYIAQRIAPVVLVDRQSDIVPKYDQSHWFRNEAVKLASTDAPPAGGYEVDTTDKYFCELYGIGHLIADDARANTDSPFNLDRDGMEWLVDKMDMARERSFISDFWKTTVWGTDKTGGSDFTKWSTFATSTPIQNLRSFKRDIRRKIARNPNILVMGDLTWDSLADHPDLLDRIKYASSSTSPAIVTPNLLAQLLELEEILIGLSIYTASPEGTAEGSVTYTANWDDDALLLYRPARASLRQPAAIYNFVWRTVFGTQRYIRRRREPLADRADLLEAFEYWDMKITAANAGLFMSDAVD